MENEINGTGKQAGCEIEPSATGMTKAEFVNLPFGDFNALMESANFTRGEKYELAVVWFTNYFTQTFRAFDRKMVGRKISPGDQTMQSALNALHMIAPCLPKSKRAGVFIPLEILLNAIAERWDDAAAPALAALQHVHELQNVVMSKTDTINEWAKSGEVVRDDEKRKRAQGVIDEYAAERQELKKALGEISAALLKANPDELKETLERIERKVDSARGEVAAARDEIADTGDRAQFAIQKGFEGLEPTQEQVEYLAHKKRNRAIKGKIAQKKAVVDPDIAAAQKKAAADMRRAIRMVGDDPDVQRGEHGAVLAACRRVCDWKDDAGHIHHGKFTVLSTSKKFGEPQYAPLLDWTGEHPIKPETLAKNYREYIKARGNAVN